MTTEFKNKLLDLWNAANAHSVIVNGDFLEEDPSFIDDCGCIPLPENIEDVIDKVTDYLKGSV